MTGMVMDETRNIPRELGRCPCPIKPARRVTAARLTSVGGLLVFRIASTGVVPSTRNPIGPGGPSPSRTDAPVFRTVWTTISNTTSSRSTTTGSSGAPIAASSLAATFLEPFGSARVHRRHSGGLIPAAPRPVGASFGFRAGSSSAATTGGLWRSRGTRPFWLFIQPSVSPDVHTQPGKSLAYDVRRGVRSDVVPVLAWKVG